MATAIVLGSAQDGGNPQLGSLGTGLRRLVASLAVVDELGAALLIDVTPDVREQLAALGGHPMYVPPDRENVIDHVALTHAHMGHYAGLVHFGAEAHNSRGVTCWMTSSMAEYLITNQPWRALFDNGNLVADTSPSFSPFAGVRVRQIPVPHRPDFTDAVGYSINDELLYLPDIDSWEAWPDAEAEIALHRIALLDATFFSADELPGRDLGQIPHPFVTDTVERFAGIGTRIILTHLNHSNPIGDPNSPQAALVIEAGMEVAYDGMEIAVGEGDRSGRVDRQL